MAADVATAGPSLSVVLVEGDHGTRAGLQRALDSIRAQACFPEIEVVLVDCSAPGTPSLAGSQLPNIRTVKLPRDGTTLAQARAEGVRQARAPLVAFLDDHSMAMAGWAEALIAAHAGPWAGVGGEIYNLSSGSSGAEPIYLMGHGRWMPPAASGEVDLLPAHDTCYKRSVLLAYGPELPRLLMAEPVLMWKLRRDGHRLYLDPAVKSLHGYAVNPLTLVAFYAWSRCFGAARAETFSWSPARRLAQLLLMPLIPWTRAFQLLRQLWRRNRGSLWVFISGLPFILLAQSAAALGEGLGALAGVGQAELLFTQTHLRGLRLRPER